MTLIPMALGAPWAAAIQSPWSLRRLKDIAKVVNGFPFNSKEFDASGQHALVRIRDLNSSNTETRYSGAWVDAAAIDTGDVLVGMDGDFNVGTWQGGRALLNQRMCCVRGESPMMSRFLRYVLPTPLQVTNDLTYFTTVKHLSSGDVERFTIPVPSSNLLESLVGFLDEQTARIDALIAEKTALLDKLDEYRLSSIYQCLSHGLTGSATTATGDDWFPTIPVGWTFCALNYRYDIQLGKMLDEKRLTGEYATPYLRNIDVRWGYINTDNLPLIDIAPKERDRYTVRAGDLLVCEGGVGVGRTAIWGGLQEVVGYQKALHRVRPRSTRDVPKFLYYQMQDAVWRDRVLGQEKATIPHLTAEAFRRWRLPFPPVADQRAIVAHLDALSERTSTLATHCRLHIDRLREYRSSLISAAVTGQLDFGTFKEAA